MIKQVILFECDLREETNSSMMIFESCLEELVSIDEEIGRSPGIAALYENPDVKSIAVCLYFDLDGTLKRRMGAIYRKLEKDEALAAAKEMLSTLGVKLTRTLELVKND